MRRLFLHFAIACITFSGSTHLTKILRPRVCAVPAKQTVQVVSFPPERANADAQLLAIYREYAAAQTRHDHAFFEKVEAEDFKLFLDGEVYSRAEDLKLMDESPAGLVYGIEDLNVEMKGDAAVVTGRMTERDKSGSVDSWRWLDVCVRRGGRWQVLSSTTVD